MGTIPKQFRQVSVTNAPVLVQAGNYNLVSWNLINPSSTQACYLKFCDASSANSVTVGSTAVVKTILVPFGPGTNILTNEEKNQIAFKSGIVIYAVTGIADSDTSAPLNGCYVEIGIQQNQ